MKLKILIRAATIVMTCIGRIAAQTNDATNAPIDHAQDIRVVNGQTYDVTTSKKWISITIPVGSVLMNADKIQFKSPNQPTDVMFRFPTTSYNNGKPVMANIRNFPYDGKNFALGQYNEIITGVCI